MIVELLLFSGLRTSEFCRLLVADTSVVTGAAALEVRGKPGTARSVWLPAAVDRLIRAYVRQTRPAFLPTGVAAEDPGHALVFNEHRRPYERTGLYRRVVRVLAAAGLGERASVQLLRHTYGYLAYKRSGGNLLFVQRQLGHAHPMITSIYAQFVNESYGDIADRIGNENDTRGAALRAGRARAGSTGAPR
jgi:site-specific recombinase XerD